MTSLVECSYLVPWFCCLEVLHFWLNLNDSCCSTYFYFIMTQFWYIVCVRKCIHTFIGLNLLYLLVVILVVLVIFPFSSIIFYWFVSLPFSFVVVSLTNGVLVFVSCSKNSSSFILYIFLFFCFASVSTNFGLGFFV